MFCFTPKLNPPSDTNTNIYRCGATTPAHSGATNPLRLLSTAVVVGTVKDKEDMDKEGTVPRLARPRLASRARQGTLVRPHHRVRRRGACLLRICRGVYACQ